jgi:predicted metal-binding membrane protein
MTYDSRELARVRNPVLLLSAAAWIWLLVDPGGLMMQAHCAATVFGGGLPLPASLPMLLAMNPPASLAAGWGLMLVAMMSPALILPIGHLRLRSFKRRRARAIVLFVAGYAAIWMAVGGVLLAGALAVGWLAPNSYLPAAGVTLLAIVWQLSPVKQRCLNRCHAHTELAAFGVAADLDALRFGASHGVWCAGSCWALMLSSMLLPRGHVAAMALVAVLTFSERLEYPRPPRWRWRGLGKVSRIAVAQARIRLQALQRRPAAGCAGAGVESPRLPVRAARLPK